MPLNSLLILLCTTAMLLAQPNLTSRARAIQEDLATQHALSLALKNRLFNEREASLATQINERDLKLRALRADANQTKQRQAEIQIQFEAVIAERLKLVEAIAVRDRDYAAEVAEYRRLIGGLTNSTNPEFQTALQRFADGDRLGAFPVLQQLAEAEMKAAVKATAIRNASKLRELVALAMTMRDRGEKTTADLIPLWEAAQQLDVAYHWGWVELRRLYMEAGNLPKAKQAATRSVEAAKYPEERAVSFMELGEILSASGDHLGAARQFELSLKAYQSLSQSFPSSPTAQSNTSIAHDKLGNVLLTLGEFTAAQREFELALEIMQQLVRLSPSSDTAQQGLAASHDKLGTALSIAGDLPAAKRQFELSLSIVQKLAQKNPASVKAQKNLAVGYAHAGQSFASAGDLAAAKVQFDRELAINQKLAQADLSSTEAQRNLSLSHEHLGDISLASQDFSQAQQHYGISVAIAKKLADSNPSDVATQRDLALSYDRLGDVLKQNRDLAGAKLQFERSLAIAQMQVEINPSSVVAKRDIFFCNLKLGTLTNEKQYFRAALAMGELLARTGGMEDSGQKILDVLRGKRADFQ